MNVCWCTACWCGRLPMTERTIMPIGERKLDFGRKGKYFIRKMRVRPGMVKKWAVYGPTNEQPAARFSTYEAAVAWFISESGGR